MCIVMVICGSLGFQVGLYVWHVPPAFARPAEKQRETFVEEHHVAPPKQSLRAPSTRTRVIIAGVARNIEKHMHLMKHLYTLGATFDAYHIIIFENDSTDRTAALLDRMENATILHGREVPAGSRTQRIAYARNRVLDEIRRRWAHYDYVVMKDMDGMCGSGPDTDKTYDSNMFREYFRRVNEWDVLSFRVSPYWDLWAFRHADVMPENMYGPKSSENSIRRAEDMDAFFSTHERSSLIPVDSAFMMLTIYKMHVLQNVSYSGIGIYGEMDCEHVHLHRTMKRNHGARIMVANRGFCKNLRPRSPGRAVSFGPKHVPCDVPCSWPQSHGIVATLRVQGTAHTVLFSGEGSHYYSQLKNRGNHLAYSTTSFKSDIPTVYYWWNWFQFKDVPGAWDDNWIQTKPVASAIPKLVFMARNCASKNNREQVVKDLIRRGLVDSISSCLNNKHVSQSERHDKRKVMRQYKYYAAFENGCVEDYITEKLWGAYASGTLPVYYGAPNIKEHVPPHSLIHVDDFSSTDALADYIEYLNKNQTAYDEYHAWRYKPLSKTFVEKYNMTHVDTKCRICRHVSKRLSISPCAEKCLTHLRAYYSHYYGKDVVFERTEGCNIVFREGIDVLRMDVSAYEAVEHAVKRIDGNTAICMPPLFRRLRADQIFVRTGDIHDMWIRDSAAQVWPYRNDATLVTDVLNMQRFFIEHDPYANSYHDHEVLTPSHADKRLGRTGWIATRNYELDSGCYFIRLLYHAWKHHQTPLETYRNAVRKLVDVWKTEQYHEEKSPYRYPELPRNGLGSPVAYTGMTWSGFRPSDDACKYGYHIPSNLFAAESLGRVMEMYPAMGDVSTLRDDILRGVEKYGTWQDNDVRRYCYEVDGLGNCNKMDDANVPSLLSIPYLNTVYDREVWQHTYEWVWSPENPYFFEGKAAEGIGSPHTPKDYIWPMSMIMRGLVDASQCEAMKRKVKETMTRGTIHESFHKDHAAKLTREEFAWPNALYTDMSCL